MSLVSTLKNIFPDTPDPPDPKVVEISTALDAAMLVHIVSTFVPAAFGQTFVAGISAPTPFISSLGVYLTSVLTPILTTAKTAESVPGSNHLLAWGAVQPAILALYPAVPPFMAGPDGARFWSAILITIQSIITPEFPPPPPEEDGGITEDGIITLEGAL